MDYYRVAVIVNTQGLRGELRLLPTTDFPEERFQKGVALALFDSADRYLQDLTIAAARPYKNFYLVRFDGLAHINDVEKFKGFQLKIAENSLSALPEGEFYYHEIIGCAVYEGETLIGKVSEILQPGANDVWVVERPGKRDLLLPYIPSVVHKVDIVGKRILVEIPEGLDDEN